MDFVGWNIMKILMRGIELYRQYGFHRIKVSSVVNFGFAKIRMVALIKVGGD